jgi:hypothetical protein
MRRTLLAVLTTTVLAIGLLSPPSAQAAVNAYVVAGHPLTSAPGLGQSSYFCYTGAPQAQPTPLERQGGTVGSGALGWQVAPAGSVVGPHATMAGDPTTLNRFTVDVLAPSGTTGWVRVYFEDNGDGDDVSTNEGWAEVTVPASNAWQTLDVTNWTYDWEWVFNGLDQGPRSDTVQGFAGDSGFIANAQYDVLLGCNGQPFYLDGMAVSHNADSVTYDFEPKPVEPPVCHPGHVTPGCPPPPPEHHVAHMEWSTNGRDVYDTDQVTIRYGQSLWMLGHSHVHSDAGNIWYSGTGTLWQQPVTGSRSVAAVGAFSPTQYASLRVSPKTTTIYEFAAAAHENHPATQSTPVTVLVQSRVKAEVVDKHLIEGQKLAVKGRIMPAAKRVKVTLQRKTGGRWKSVVASQTKKGGWFDIATRARTPGTWKVRVKVDSTLDNVGTTTRTARVEVDKYVPPHKHQPPPPPPQDPTPEKPTPVVTPQPTQVSTTAPLPPDRPNATRISASSRTSAVAGASTGETGRVGKP